MVRGLSCDQVRATAAPSRLSDAWKLPLPTLLASSVTLFVVGPVPGLGAGSAGGSQWGLGEGKQGGGQAASLLWQRQVTGALQCGWDLGASQLSREAVNSQECREAWNRRGSSRREDGLPGQGGDVRKGERQMGKQERSRGEG